VHERERTGVGRQVETSLIRAGCYALGWDYAIHLRYGEAVTAQPRHDRPGALAGFFRTKDERWFCMAPRGPRDFPAVMSAIGRPDYADDPRCTPPITDLEVVREVRAVLDAVFAGMTLAEAGAMLNGVDVIWAPMATLSDVVADPTAHEAGCFVETPDGWGGSFKAPAAPVRFPATTTGPTGPAPRLGEHTREVLAEAGYDQAAVEALIAGGAAT
jgi:crotonobetainyl-CoA:carnitine CoA-transferase CaiB-like acyl-CoA transferase